MAPDSPFGVGPVLAAVDFSSHSEAALLWAAQAAHKFEAPLLVLHVVHDPEAAPGYYDRSEEGRTRRMEEVAREMLDDFVLSAGEKHSVIGQPRSILTVGLPATRILEIAEREGAQLIVVGSQGRTGLAHMLLGSKATRVAQLSSIPVTIVKAKESAQS